MIDDPQRVWRAALGELALQMPRATFDMWLRDTHCVDVEDDVLVVEVKNEYAVDWLQNRLATVITRTLHRLSGNGTTARYVVRSVAPVHDESPANDLESLIAQLLDNSAARELLLARLGVVQDDEGEPAPEHWRAPAFDDSRRWFPVGEYASKFWGAYLGARAFRLWETIRRTDTRRDKTTWTPPRRFSVPQLAREIGCGKQAITGVDRACEPDREGAKRRRGRSLDGEEEGELRWYYHQPGALDVLKAAGIAEVTPHGTRRHRTYEVTVRTSLGWLSPAQLMTLDADLQTAHDEWVTEAGEDPTLWH